MEIALLTYRVTRAFPPEERFGLTAQMRRAAISIGSNIAEGCGRSTERQLLNFVQMAAGSASELDFQAQISLRLSFGTAPELEQLRDLVRIERRMLGRLSTRIRAGEGSWNQR